MQLFKKFSDIPADFGPSVVTIGNFDGVHRGHAAVLTTVVSLAQEKHLSAVAVSFDPHPIKVHRPQIALEEIMGHKERQGFLQELGIDAYLLINYTLKFSQQSPEEFVKNLFVDRLRAKYVVIGDDVRFGKDNSGDLSTMKELGGKYGFEVVAVADLMADETRRCSSTRIRELLSAGEIEEANRLLGRAHLMTGEIVHGLARGRELGFPTANMSFDSKGFIPADGVYAGWLIDQAGNRHPVATSVGTNPTFEGITQRQVEAHVIGRPEEAVSDFDLYGQQVTLEFIARLRPMIAYTGPEALIAQISKDVEDAQKVLGLEK